MTVELFDKAIEAMHSVNGMCRTHYLAIDCKIDMFD